MAKYLDLDGLKTLAATIKGRFAPLSHKHETADIAGLDSALAGKAAASHTHTVDQVSGTLPITKGGTGATTAKDARNSLGLGILKDEQAIDGARNVFMAQPDSSGSLRYHPLSDIWDWMDGLFAEKYVAKSELIRDPYGETDLKYVSGDGIISIPLPEGPRILFPDTASVKIMGGYGGSISDVTCTESDLGATVRFHFSSAGDVPGLTVKFRATVRVAVFGGF